MANTNKMDMVFHQIRAKLYPSYLSTVDGAYIARADNEKTLSVEDVCRILKTRAGFTGKYEDLLEFVRQYYDEVAYQLCDGYAVTNGYYTIHPKIGGAFKSEAEAHDHEKHPVRVCFGARAKLRNLLNDVEVDITGVADSSGYIDTFTDFDEESVNEIISPGSQFAIHGHKIKVTGDDPSVGVYLVPVDDPAKAVKVERIAENNPTKVTGIVPCTHYKLNKVEIRTQYAGSNNIKLKTPRIITSRFVLEMTA